MGRCGCPQRTETQRLFGTITQRQLIIYSNLHLALRLDPGPWNARVAPRASLLRVSNALTKVFLLVFILYPGLTNKIFEGLICRDLGGDPLTSVLAVDYRVECEENMTSRYVRQMLLIVIWPVGVPTLLFLAAGGRPPQAAEGWAVLRVCSR